jgi:hypothetical protein
MTLRTLFIAGLLGWLCSGAIAAGDAPASILVHKVAEDFEQIAWAPDQWNTAAGHTSLVDEPAPDVKTAKSLKIDVHFAGNGFAFFSAVPAAPLWIPGDAKSVTLRYKISDGRYALKMGFVDGWGRDQAGGTPLSWDLRTDPSAAWKTATFQVPEAWVRPIRISGITTHNWEARNVKGTLHVQIDDIEVETDIKDVDPETGVLRTWAPEPNPAKPDKALHECPRTPLLVVNIASGQECNVFAGAEPQVSVRVQNWKPGRLTGKLACRLFDASGGLADQFDRPISVDSSAGLTAPLKAERFGLYTLSAKLSVSDGTNRSEQMLLAHLPPAQDLTAREATASPYGLNVHSGDKAVLVPFRKAGIVWFREYAFSYDWLLRAKGEDGKYALWPNFPKIVAAYREAGARCLPVLQKSITRPAAVNGKVAGPIGPDRAWTREICGIINAFPEITHWELSNEYDLPADNWKVEETIDWANYRAYHRQFADILRLLGGGELVAVENGRAGIWPQRVLGCVQSGDFAGIAVVNSHHYCGTDAPEVNLCNFNMGYEGKPPSLLFDDLRAVKRAAQADGRPRQSWLTEFGWDTLAGPAVSPYQQAVYLPRAWMMAMAAGTDKAFWFYNFDAANPKQFFDGCGLLTAKGEPKLALCSMAGLTSALPAPVYVGDLDAGENTCGYVFESRGTLVAALWTIRGDDGPTVRFQADRLQDYLGNRIEGQAVRLTMAPVYALGLSKSDAWYRQTAYSLQTPHLMLATAGDVVRPVMHIANNCDAPIFCRIQLELPEGWKAESPVVPAGVAPGEAANIELPYTIPPAETPGFKDLKLVVSEGKEIKRMAVKVLVQALLTVQVSPIEGRPGPTQVTVHVGNRSARTTSGTLRMRLPGSWKALSPETRIADLKPQEVRPLVCRFNWSADWKPDETAQVELDFGADGKSARSLIPNQFAIHKAGSIKLDGRLHDWGPRTQLPAWMLGCTAGESRAAIHLAWAAEGIYCAVVVHDSKVQVKDPASFWAGDALELFLDTADSKQPREAAAGDHQFWFVPLVDEHRVYAGQWKIKGETAATRYDIPAVRGVAARTADGYVMEFLLPAGQIVNYRPEAGGRLGLNLNLTIQGTQSAREAYWPSPKSSGATAHPDRWGSVLLAE